MDANMTFRMEADVKSRMISICNQLGMTPSTAFNLFAKAFIREGGMPFDVKLKESPTYLADDALLAKADAILQEYADDYERMAK